METFNRSTLEGLYNDVLVAVRKGSASDLESKLCVAAGHALDLMDIVDDSDGDLELDLTAETEEAVPMAVSLVHIVSLASGNTNISDGKKYIVKKLGSYELFAIYNELLRAGYTADFIVDDDVVKIKSTATDGSILVFDAYGAMTDAIKEYILATDPGAGFIAFGTMQPFYDRLVKEFLDKLS